VTTSPIDLLLLQKAEAYAPAGVEHRPQHQKRKLGSLRKAMGWTPPDGIEVPEWRC
jgi:hypothetical protein